MDKTSCQCLSFRLHPKMGASSGEWLWAPGWRESVSVQSAYRGPEFPKGRVITEGFLEERVGLEAVLWLLAWEAGGLSSTQTPHKSNDYIILVSLCP